MWEKEKAYKEFVIGSFEILQNQLKDSQGVLTRCVSQGFEKNMKHLW